jgi:predicted nucleic acid-binding protein
VENEGRALRSTRALALVETSAWIEVLRPKGNPQIRQEVAERMREGTAAWCEMVRLELWNGALAKEMPDLQELGRHIILLETTAGVWTAAELLSRKARGAGMTLPAADLLIAACARHHGAEIIHRDRHFDQIKTL